ncbi:alpha/beta hydrolase [Ferrovibrio sp.]|uniref:alpha/beta hydrolase n=1 Tax=Ferrovibrio sp. TaxID=1917215 RepID=UPI0025C238B0|nr:alpha/beta hydrolase [Ferrovibrio sp.]MBX3454865.1 alpha/beta hydrolase [Ferrovibrio sp.]
MTEIAHLPQPAGYTIAYCHTPANGPTPLPGIVFCGGFRSDMTGTKAIALEQAALATGRGFTRFDYFAHGASPGDFAQGSIGRWLEDTLAILDRVTQGANQGAQILVGSSMGGWLATLAALKRPERVAGLVLIAPALDFTEDLLLATLTPEQRAALERDGVYREPSHYSEQPYEFHWHLIAEGRKHLLLDKPLDLPCPVRILQGMQDPDVPWQHALRIAESITQPDTRLTLLKDGDHRLSRPQDIDLLVETVLGM